MRKPDPIKKITLKSGATVYRFVIDVGRRPDGRRDQRTHTFPHQEGGERGTRARIIADRTRGTYVKATKKTLNEHLDESLAGRRKVRASTLGNYRNALLPVRERYGHLALRELTKGHIDAIVNTMLASGRRVGTRGRPLAPATVTLMLTVLAIALDDAVKQGLLVRNIARLVDRPGTVPQKEMATWTAEQAAAFLGSTADDRLSVAWQCSLFGLRRGEVLGLRWCDIDLDAATMTVAVTRIIIEGETVHSEPKSERGKRTLPLDAGLDLGCAGCTPGRRPSGSLRALRMRAPAPIAARRTSSSTSSASRCIRRATATDSRCWCARPGYRRSGYTTPATPAAR